MPPNTEDPVSQPYPSYPQPNYPQGPPQGQPQWPTQQPGYAPQQYPPGYGQPQQPYPQQGYGQAPPPVQHEFAQGSLDAFYAQPRAGGGGGLKFPQAGVGHMIIVNRGLVDGDTEQQTDMETNTVPQFDKKGQPKFVLKVPVNVVLDANNPEGVAKWYLQGGAVDDLARAQALAGSTAPPGLPEAGSAIWVQLTGKRKAGNFQANTWDIRYWRPGPDAQAIAAQYGIVYPELSAAGQQATLDREQAQAATPPVQAAQNNGPVPPVAPVQTPPQLQTPPGAPAVNGPQYPAQQPPMQAPPVQQYAPQVAPQGQQPPAQAPPAPADISSLPPEKQALYGQLTGAPQG